MQITKVTTFPAKCVNNYCQISTILANFLFSIRPLKLLPYDTNHTLCFNIKVCLCQQFKWSPVSAYACHQMLTNAAKKTPIASEYNGTTLVQLAAEN